MVTEKDVLAIFNLEGVEFAEAIQHLPVADINAISTDLISGPCFEFFVGYMQLIITYEHKLQEQIITIYNLISKLKNNNHKPIHISHNLAIIIKRRILAFNYYKIQRDRARRLYREGRIKKWKISDLKMGEMRYKVNTEHVEGFEFVTMNFNKELTYKDIDTMLGKLQAEINKSNDRITRNRRSEFRKAVTQNYKVLFQDFLEKESESYQLHDTKIDRLVIDVYSPDLMTHDKVLKSHLNKKEKKLKKTHDKKEIPTQDFIKAIRSLYKHEIKDIDELVKEFEHDRKQKLLLGYERKGQIISEQDIGKIIFTYNPEDSGAPIRLRIIANVQNYVRRKLFEKNPEKEAIYKERTWSAGSELNFILPEDEELYYQMEYEICAMLEHKAKELFTEYVNKNVGAAVRDNCVVIYVSQVEVCHEERFNPRKPAATLYRDKCNNPNLFEFMHKRQAYYHRFSNRYCDVDYDGINDRPSLHMDIFSINPEFPIMQYKVYPKFYDENKNIMLRSEMIPTRFIKFLAMDDNGLPLSQLVLSKPAYVREMIERLFQFELKCNGVQGHSYNKRFKECARPNHEGLSTTLIGKAIFGRKADQYEIELEKIKGGRIPLTIPIYYRNKMVKMGIATKIKRGTYATTGSFNEIIKKLYQVR